MKMQAPTAFNDALSGLISRWKELRKIEFHELESVLRESEERLFPLDEPLRQDLGLHRWLSRAREESYSDWLQWLFRQMTCSEISQVLELGLETELEPTQLSKLVEIEREVCVSKGNEGQSGRLDMSFKVGNRIIILEVKLGTEESAETQKQSGYITSIKEDHPNDGVEPICVLLVTSSTRDQSNGFTVLPYRRFCLAVRYLAWAWIHKSRTSSEKPMVSPAALALMVVGALETNLMGMSAQRHSFNSETLSYLRRYLEITGKELDVAK